jgi:hypothetical protein
MSFRLVQGSGSANDVAGFSFAASGTIKNGEPVDFLRTGGVVVGPSGSSSTTTMVFGIANDYVQGASDVQVKVVPFNDGQLWEADCANAASTAQVGIRHALSAARDSIHNTATDVSGATGVFLAVAMVGATTGSGKLLGKFISNIVPTGQNQTTFN